ncbi:MAG: hypothetical protein XD65_0572 [Caldanaerobacter subterraneus]|jgi:hypothetical protein|nr:MAG: Orn/Lys/Arg decarboxylase [Thermoanaerobacter thermocopriae]KUK35096.1 MAG: hypothetical protein XD65_0572 [Caldanaerobacter subterraneus]MDI3529569.1 hypothetical protein [Thermoanaerobacter sp.]
MKTGYESGFHIFLWYNQNNEKLRLHGGIV